MVPANSQWTHVSVSIAGDGVPIWRENHDRRLHLINYFTVQLRPQTRALTLFFKHLGLVQVWLIVAAFAPKWILTLFFYELDLLPSSRNLSCEFLYLAYLGVLIAKTPDLVRKIVEENTGHCPRLPLTIRPKIIILGVRRVSGRGRHDFVLVHNVRMSLVDGVGSILLLYDILVTFWRQLQVHRI